MLIQVLGGYGGESLDCRMTCLLVNGTVALDAGSLSQALPIERQVGVHSIILSHSHMDHTNSLPFFIENVYGKSERAIDIHASEATIYAIRKYLFNNATWPNFTRLPNHLLPAVRFMEFQKEQPLVIDGVSFTPIAVDHLVPTHGFLIEQDGAAILWSSDTGPTQRFWEIANRTLARSPSVSSYEIGRMPLPAMPSIIKRDRWFRGHPIEMGRRARRSSPIASASSAVGLRRPVVINVAHASSMSCGIRRRVTCSTCRRVSASAAGAGVPTPSTYVPRSR